MEKHHPSWNSVVGALKFVNNVVKAAEAHDERELLKALHGAYNNWSSFEKCVEDVADYFHDQMQPAAHHKYDYFTGTWVASDSKKTDYINQNGEYIVYSTPAADGRSYNVYVGRITSNGNFTVVGNNSRRDIVVINGQANNNLTEITCKYFVPAATNDSLKSGTYYLDRR